MSEAGEAQAPLAEFQRPRMIRFSDCDPAGIVFYPQYFVMLNGLVEDWVSDGLGIDYHALIGERRIGLPTVRLKADFRAVSRMGDKVTLGLAVERLGSRSMTLVLRCFDPASGELRMQMKQVLVTTSLESHRAVEIPQDIRAAILHRTGSSASTITDMKESRMDKQTIIESLERALESWIRHAVAAQLWQVQQQGGLGASIVADEDLVHIRVELGGPRNPLSELGRTDGRLPVTEAFLGRGLTSWGTPPPQGDDAREAWFLSSELAQEHARQYLLAEVREKRDVLSRFVEGWLTGKS